MTDSTTPLGSPLSQETTFFGATIPAVFSNTAHVWTANASGLFVTAADLATEWKTYYDTMMAGHADTLSFIQRLEGNAEAVFEHTGLAKLDTATQARDRMDWQREWDAVGVAWTQLGLDAKAPLTTQQYLSIENTIRSSATLQELAMQGHGLNSPSSPKYNGYTNDFQNNTDNATLYVGGGLDNNQTAVPNLFDDALLSHLPFPTVAQNGHLEQLNQNGASEDTLADATGALDLFGAQKVLTAADFSLVPGTASSTVAAPPDAPVPPAPAGTMYTLFGVAISTTQVVNGHIWTADPNGLFVTNANLGAEWKGYYQQMLNGNGASLAPTQRLEGNVEALFENTGLARVALTNATQMRYDRMDIQREIDALSAVMTQLGLGSAPLTQAGFLALEQALQNDPANAALEELGVQGHGLNGFAQTKYAGYTNDIQNVVDNKTLYAGSGQDAGERAIADFLDDNLLTHVLFPTIAQNGEIIQLNQNGATEETVQAQVEALNASMFTQVLTKADFNVPGNPQAVGNTPTEQPAGTETTFFGATIAASMTANGHVWTVGTDGKFHTETNLQTEWAGYYQTMLAGNGASLTAIQRLEGNAEAVFENTGLANTKTYNAAKQQSFREDAQREFDAIAATMSSLGLGSALLNNQDYLNIETALQNNTALEELAMQGHGLNSPSQPKYNGYTNDFQNNSDNTTYFVGSGLDNGEKAISAFFDDVIMTHIPFPTVSTNGALTQLNQNANNEDALTNAVSGANEAMFQRVFVAGDFGKVATASGPVVWVTPAMATAVPHAGPAAGANQMLSLGGFVVSTTIVANGDTWVADAQGRYQTTADLTLRWYDAYRTALAGGPLTTFQHWEAQAEAVFENTGLSQQGEGQQAIDRADVQREMDAVAAVMTSLGLMDANGNVAGPLTVANELAIEHALQSNSGLEELAIQGHGLNNPYVAGVTKYNGYTNDFQHNIDNRTLYVGGGQDTGERAVPDFFDDIIMTHQPFATVARNGELTQLNQNGNAESTALAAVAGFNQSLFGRILTQADFLTPGKEPRPAPPVPPATVTTLYGDTIAGTQTIGGHVWTADANGLFHTTANLGMEWRGYYQTVLAGQGGGLTATQLLEANAEAFFENTAINNQWMGAAKEAAQREDVQRQIDAIGAAMQTDKTVFGIDPTATLTEASYLRLGTTIQSDAVLAEFSLQGHGVASPPSVRYRGAYADFMSTADWSTYFVGGGAGNATLALPYAFANVVSNLAFATAFQNGHWEQLDMWGNGAATVVQAATALNNAMFHQVFVAGDFSANPVASGPAVAIPGAKPIAAAPIAAVSAPAGKVLTLTGQTISTVLLANGHTWIADTSGLYHTANLAAEWTGYYAQMLAGNAGALSETQRQEGNAEAVFEATGLTKLGAAAQQTYREDTQRVLDAEAGAISIVAAALNLPQSAAMLAGHHIPVARALRDNAGLAELAVQGFGLNGMANSRYAGYLNDFSTASKVKYAGGGVNTGKNALSVFMAENVMSFTPFAVIWKNGKLVQLNQNGDVGDTLSNQIAAIGDTTTLKVYKKADFK